MEGRRVAHYRIIERIVNRPLGKRADERYQTMADLVAEFAGLSSFVIRNRRRDQLRVS